MSQPKLTLKQWSSTTDKIAVAKYGITPEDGGYDKDALRQQWAWGTTPEEFVDYWGEKFDLEPVERGAYGR